MTPPAAFPSSETTPGRNDALERFVGGKLAAWVGAMVVIAGLGIFAKFAYDEGWFARLSPLERWSLGVVASLGFVLAGELWRGRIGSVPASGLTAAGVGGLYVSVYAGNQVLGVIGDLASIGSCAFAVALGTALTLRSRSLLVGTASLAGGYSAFLFARPLADGDGWLAPAYLTVLLASALALSALGPPRFRGLRWVDVVHGVAALVWTYRGADLSLVFAFTSVWWLLVVGESTLAALRGRTVRMNATFTILATGVAAIAAARGVGTGEPLVWLPGVLAGLATAGAWQLGGLSGWRGGPVPPESADLDRAERAIVRQGRVLAAVAAMLVVVQAGFVLERGALVVTWAAMGLVAVIAGVRLRQRGLAIGGFVALFLGAVAALGLAGLGLGTVVWEWPAPGTATPKFAWTIALRDGWWAPVGTAFALFFAARSWTLAARAAGGDPDRPPRLSTLASATAAILWTVLSLAYLDGYAAIAGLLAVPVIGALGGLTGSLVKSIGLAWCIIAGFGWLVFTILLTDELPPGRPDGGVLLAALVTGSFSVLTLRFRNEPFGDTALSLGVLFGLGALGVTAWLDAFYGMSADAPVTNALAAAAVGLVASLVTVGAASDRWELVARTALVALVLSAITWLTVGSVLGDLAAGTVASRPWLVNGQNLAAAVLAVAFVVARGSVRGPGADRWGEALDFLLVAVASVATSLSLWRLLDPVHGPVGGSRGLQEYSQSIWWAAIALAIVVFGFRRNRPALRWVGLVALGLVALKVLVLDLRNAATIWRVVALIAIGLILVGTSVVYTRANATERPERP